MEDRVLDLSNEAGAGLLLRVASLPRIPEGLAADRHLELVLEEAALLDFVKSFAYLVNAADVDAVVGNYADDGIWNSPRGRFVGSDEIRRNYGLYFNPVRWFSFWTNVTVRFVRPFEEAYIAAYQYSIGASGTDDTLGAVSTDVWRVTKAGESWKIAERRIDILDSHAHRLLPPSAA
jgi:ketosteroid isomerase-like protein